MYLDFDLVAMKDSARVEMSARSSSAVVVIVIRDSLPDIALLFGKEKHCMHRAVNKPSAVRGRVSGAPTIDTEDLMPHSR